MYNRGGTYPPGCLPEMYNRVYLPICLPVYTFVGGIPPYCASLCVYLRVYRTACYTYVPQGVQLLGTMRRKEASFPQGERGQLCAEYSRSPWVIQRGEECSLFSLGMMATRRRVFPVLPGWYGNEAKSAPVLPVLIRQRGEECSPSSRG